MFNLWIGEWSQYETWELREIIDNLENDLASAQMALQARVAEKRKNFSRAERGTQIIRLLRDGKVRTTSQIAKALGMSASGHLRDILCELYKNQSIAGYAQGNVAHHYIYYWYDQRTLPLPFQESASAPPCQTVDYPDVALKESVAR